MKCTLLIAALATVTSLAACMGDGDVATPSTTPVVVSPRATPPSTRPVVSGQSGRSLDQTIRGKGPVVVDP